MKLRVGGGGPGEAPRNSSRCMKRKCNVNRPALRGMAENWGKKCTPFLITVAIWLVLFGLGSIPAKLAMRLNKKLEEEAMQQAAKEAATAENQRWSSGMLFRFVSPHSVEGVIMLAIDSPFFQAFPEQPVKLKAENWGPNWKGTERCEEKSCMHEWIGSGTGCRICLLSRPSTTCMEGKLRASTHREDLVEPVIAHHTQFETYQRSSVQINHRPRCNYATLMLHCELLNPVLPKINVDDEPVILVDALPGFRANVDVNQMSIITLRQPQPQPPPIDVICGRTMYFNLEPRWVTRWTDYYTLTPWRFSRVVVYAIGLDRNIKNHPAVQRRIRQGRLILVDLRDELQYMVGQLSTDMGLYTLGQLQILAKIDCLSRARSLGVRWTVHVDFDELLVPGMLSSSSTPLKWVWDRDVIVPATKQHETQQRVAGGGAAELLWITFPSWDYPRNTTERLCQEFDVSTTFYPNHAIMPQAIRTVGSRKLAVRLDFDHIQPLNAAEVGVHRMHTCAYPLDCAMFLRSGEDVDTDILVVNHHRCLNLEMAQVFGGRHGDVFGSRAWFKTPKVRHTKVEVD